MHLPCPRNTRSQCSGDFPQRPWVATFDPWTSSWCCGPELTAEKLGGFSRVALVMSRGNGPAIQTSSSVEWNQDYPSEHIPWFSGRQPIWKTQILTFWDISISFLSLYHFCEWLASPAIPENQRDKAFLPTIYSPGLEDTLLGIEFTHSASEPSLTPLTAHWCLDPMSEANRLLVLSWGGLCLLGVKCSVEVLQSLIHSVWQ